MNKHRLNHLDALRAFAMTYGVFLHAGLGTSYWVALMVNDFSTLFRMKLFMIVAGYFAALIVSRRGVAAGRRDRLIRFGIPAVIITLFVTPLANWFFINRFGAPVPLMTFLTAPLAWTKAGFDWGDVPIFVSWHAQAWFLFVALAFCLLLRPLWALCTSPAMARGVRLLTGDGARPALALALLTIIMTMMFLGGRIVHFATTQQLFGDGPFNFLFQNFWIYLGFFTLGMLLFRYENLFALMHRPVIWQLVVAAGCYALARWLTPMATAAFGKIGTETLAFVGEGLLGFQLCVALFWLFRRFTAQPSQLARMLSDASYTIFLFHVVVIAGLFYATDGIALAQPVRYFGTATATFAICLMIHWLVVDRNAVTRLLLNGKPFKRRPSNSVICLPAAPISTG